MSTAIYKSQGLAELNVKYAASSPDKAPPQAPESAMEHDEIGQFAVSELLKNASHVVKPDSGVIVTPPLPDE